MNDFDPLQHGATNTQNTPSPSSDGFNPTQYGATPYDPASSDINKSASLLGVSTAANERLQQPDPQSQQDEFASVSGVGHAIGDIAQGAVDTALHPVKNIVNPAIKFIGSALSSPIDIVRGLFGKAPLNQPIGQFGAPSVNSIQTDAANNASDVYDQKITPLDATIQTVGDTLQGAGSTLGAGELSGVGKVPIKGLASSIEKKGASALVGEGTAQKVATAVAKSPADIAIEAASPRLTPKVAEGATTTTSPIRGKISIVPQNRTKEIADAITGIVKGQSASQDKELVTKALEKEANDLSTKVGSINQNTSTKGVKTWLDQVSKPIEIESDPVQSRKFDLTKDTLLKIIDKNDKNVGGLFKARKEFDALVNKEFPNLWDKENAPFRSAVKGMRDAVNNSIEANLPDGLGYKESLKKQSLMYDAIDNLGEKAAKGTPKVQGEIGTTRLGRFSEKHPTATKVIKGAGATAAVGAIGKGAYDTAGKLGL